MQYTAEGIVPASVIIKVRGRTTDGAYIIVCVPGVEEDRLIPPRCGVRYSIRRRYIVLKRKLLVNYCLRVQV